MSTSKLLAMMAVLFTLGLANIFLRSSMGVLAPELSAELALRPELLGGIASAFFFSYAIMQIPAGMMLDRFGPRRTVTGLFALTALGTFLFAWAPSGGWMMLARALMGIGCAAIFAGTFMLIGRFYSTAQLTSIGGLMNSYGMLGTFLATAPLAYLVSLTGWRDGFALIAAIAAVLVVLAGLTIRDKPPTADETIAAGERESLGQVLSGLMAVVRLPGMPAIASGGIALSAGNTFLGIWGGPYLHTAFGLDETGRGGVLMFMAIGGVFGHFLYGQAARRLNTLKGLVLFGCAAILAIMSTLALMPNPSVTLVTILLALLGLVCGFPTILLAHARAMVPEHQAGRGMTTVNTGVMVSIACMQIAIGAIIGAAAENGAVTLEAYRTAFGFVAAMALLTLLIYLKAPDKKPND